MVKFSNINQEKPYLLFKTKYEEAFCAKQKSIEAIFISSYNTKKNEVDSRCVNLKFVNDNEFVFFSNYNSPKACAFESHNQIAAVIYWSRTDTQIRMKANIKKTSNEYNQKYFYQRDKEKNAIAISSAQSKSINSYSHVIDNFDKSLKYDDLKKCPNYWGGFSFIPYYFEFWEGHESRINKREVFDQIDGRWRHSFLQP